ncbi:MAG TPA: hypothetical protein VLE53_18935 [Gemmatimonadaceae bacterium]|nr:hypothetical protein [Gemmatimonadaceae bacterium]
MPERRYSDEEVAEIFARATEAEHSSPRRLGSAEGMTLHQLQEIGKEAGISPELVVLAAHSLDEPAQPAVKKFLGFPLGVGRTVMLDRRLTDDEWERLVVDLRETFDARGVVRTDGAFRQWTNGNLQCLVEPDGAGQRIRLRTLRSGAREMMLAGIGIAGVAAISAFAGMITVGSVDPLSAVGRVGELFLIGGGIFALGAFRLPSWAKRRRKQMDEIADRLTLPR